VGGGGACLLTLRETGDSRKGKKKKHSGPQKGIRSLLHALTQEGNSNRFYRSLSGSPDRKALRFSSARKGGKNRQLKGLSQPPIRGIMPAKRDNLLQEQGAGGGGGGPKQGRAQSKETKAA